MRLDNLVGDGIALSEQDRALEIAGMTADSRKVKPGFLFAAMPGTELDGADFIEAAIQNGAAAVLTHARANTPDASVPIIKAENVHRMLALAAAGFFPNQPETMVAVTGTAGKTSVASFLRQVWEQDEKPAASIGTTGVIAPGRNEYGSLTTPDPVALHSLLNDLANEGVTHGAMEASSHGLDQHRLDGVRLKAAGFTNLGRDHMDYHPTIEDYFNAKMRLFKDLLPAGSPAVIFADDPFTEQAAAVAKKAGHDVRLVGRHGDFLQLKRVEHERYRQIVEVHYGEQIHRIEFPLAGDFQIANGMVTAGLAISSGVDPQTAIHSLENLKGAPGRLELAGSSRTGAPAYVDYAHKPEALENVLKSLRPFTSGKLMLVFGCGGDRDRGKRPIMGEIAERLADTVIVTDDNPRSENPAVIRASILEACPKAMEIGDRKKAIEEAVSLLQEGDCLVVAGKGHEEGQIVGDEVLPFSDMTVLQYALKA